MSLKKARSGSSRNTNAVHIDHTRSELGSWQTDTVPRNSAWSLSMTKSSRAGELGAAERIAVSIIGLKTDLGAVTRKRVRFVRPWTGSVEVRVEREARVNVGIAEKRIAKRIEGSAPAGAGGTLRVTSAADARTTQRPRKSIDG